MVKEDMAEVEVTEEDAENRRNWRWKMRCGDPWWEKPERRRRSRSEIEVKIQFEVTLMFSISLL